jgi:hypothetical protein
VAGYTAAFATAHPATLAKPASSEQPLGPFMAPATAQYLVEIR